MATSPDSVLLADSFDYAGERGTDPDWKINLTAISLFISADVCHLPFHSASPL
jgi:hypothetical protein